MRSIRCLLCSAFFLAYFHTLSSAEEPIPKRTLPIATSGQIEVDAIRIARVKVSGASPNADLTKMRLSLWIDVKDAKAREFLMRLVKLDPVVDDTGKLLSTKDRRKKILSLKKEVRTTGRKTFRGRNGPIVPWLFDAPARGASRIKTFKGRIEITPIGREEIVLKDLPSLVGKQIKHDLLAATNIVPRFDIGNDVTEITLAVTGQHDRLIAWTVAQDGKPLRAVMRGRGAADDSIQEVIKGLSTVSA